MKLTKSQLKQIIMEEITKVLKENDAPLNVEFSGWEGAYDQTIWTLNVNGEKVEVYISGSPEADVTAEYLAPEAVNHVYGDEEERPELEERAELEAAIIKQLMSNSNFIDAVDEANAAVNQYAEDQYREEW